MSPVRTIETCLWRIAGGAPLTPSSGIAWIDAVVAPPRVDSKGAVHEALRQRFSSTVLPLSVAASIGTLKVATMAALMQAWTHSAFGVTSITRGSANFTVTSEWPSFTGPVGTPPGGAASSGVTEAVSGVGVPGEVSWMPFAGCVQAALRGAIRLRYGPSFDQAIA